MKLFLSADIMCTSVAMYSCPNLCCCDLFWLRVKKRNLGNWFIPNETITQKYSFDGKMINKDCVLIYNTFMLNDWSWKTFRSISVLLMFYTYQIHENPTPRGLQPTRRNAVTRWSGAVGLRICTWDQITEGICTTLMLARMLASGQFIFSSQGQRVV